jgi:hypothetical protein
MRRRKKKKTTTKRLRHRRPKSSRVARKRKTNSRKSMKSAPRMMMRTDHILCDTAHAFATIYTDMDSWIWNTEGYWGITWLGRRIWGDRSL